MTSEAPHGHQDGQQAAEQVYRAHRHGMPGRAGLTHIHYHDPKVPHDH